MPLSIEDSDQRFRMLVEAVEEYAIYMLDANGIVVTWNSGAQRNKGYAAEEIIGKSFERFFPPEAVAEDVPRQILKTARETGAFKGEGWRVRKDRSRFWASVVVTAIRDEDGQTIGFVKVTRDLTERKQYEDALQTERDRLRVTLNSIADGVICTDGTGRVELMNPAAQTMTGWTAEEARERPIEEVFRLVDSTRRTEITNPVRICLSSERASFLQENANLFRKDGSEFAIQDSAAPIRSACGDIIGAVLVFQDVTGLRAAHEELAFHATHDSLTRLPNRQRFLASLQLALRQTELTGGEQTLCFLDLDGFKSVNDDAGHAAGDAMLQRVGETLRQNIRSADIVARLGGDEFAIILNGCIPSNAKELLVKVLSDIEAIDFQWAGKQFRISASVGATSIRAGVDAAAILTEADAACYAAKRLGRNQISVHESSSHS